MCFLFHRFELVSSDEKEKLFVRNRATFKLAYKTKWVCSDCKKEITKRISKGESGWITLKNFLLKQKGKSHQKLSCGI